MRIGIPLADHSSVERAKPFRPFASPLSDRLAAVERPVAITSLLTRASTCQPGGKEQSEDLHSGAPLHARARGVVRAYFESRPFESSGRSNSSVASSAYSRLEILSRCEA